MKNAEIYCHHHSKGSQGNKKSMDRASGSGVFARDPDAMSLIRSHLIEHTPDQPLDGPLMLSAQWMFRANEKHKTDSGGQRSRIWIMPTRCCRTRCRNLASSRMTSRSVSCRSGRSTALFLAFISNWWSSMNRPKTSYVNLKNVYSRGEFESEVIRIQKTGAQVISYQWSEYSGEGVIFFVKPEDRCKPCETCDHFKKSRYFSHVCDVSWEPVTPNWGCDSWKEAQDDKA